VQEGDRLQWNMKGNWLLLLNQCNLPAIQMKKYIYEDWVYVVICKFNSCLKEVHSIPFTYIDVYKILVCSVGISLDRKQCLLNNEEKQILRMSVLL
jgi:hypothetical protein